MYAFLKTKKKHPQINTIKQIDCGDNTIIENLKMIDTCTLMWQFLFIKKWKLFKSLTLYKLKNNSQ